MSAESIPMIWRNRTIVTVGDVVDAAVCIHTLNEGEAFAETLVTHEVVTNPGTARKGAAGIQAGNLRHMLGRMEVGAEVQRRVTHYVIRPLENIAAHGEIY